ncbi:hypothetical protein NQ317_012973 [Molorchus minor]|uniref:Uncharacterized protein n=1 Tax=Molorchus minor TaxID=1323400 RepID=A0ABQ9JF93_9CUCU|nr:hypothetical protein NQ317_012973 [Molorchus minor]
MSINSYQGYLELGACFCIFELSTGSSSELALCSPSISQGIMPDLTQGTFEFMEESLNELSKFDAQTREHNQIRQWLSIHILLYISRRPVGIADGAAYSITQKDLYVKT